MSDSKKTIEELKAILGDCPRIPYREPTNEELTKGIAEGFDLAETQEILRKMQKRVDAVNEEQKRELLLGYSRDEWYEHCIAHGTSGDQVHSVLRDWANRNDLVATGLNNLLLDLYPLTIANAPMDAGEQRQFADDVAKHIGKIREHLGVKPYLELKR